MENKKKNEIQVPFLLKGHILCYVASCRDGKNHKKKKMITRTH